MSTQHPNALIPQLEELAKSRLDIPGGCDACDAYQRLRQVADGVFVLDIFHDGDCPAYGGRDGES
jgi:hypothetical protein